MWVPSLWKPFFAIWPRMGIFGPVWGLCMRRRLTYRYNDGYDHMRQRRVVWQYRPLRESE